MLGTAVGRKIKMWQIKG